MEQLIDNYSKTVQLLGNRLKVSSERFGKLVIKADRMKPKPLLSKAYTELMKSYKYKAKKRISGLDTDNFWDKFVKERYPEEKCIEVFKCSRSTFIYLIKILRPYISPKQSATPINPSLHMLKGVSVEKQVAVMLHKLTHNTEYAAISAMFGIHKSTSHKMFYKAVTGLNKYLIFKEIKMPKSDEIKTIVQDFEEKSGISQILGVLDYTHIPCAPSPTMVKEFTNKKKYCSFVLQTVVDSNLCFRDISIRHPGGRNPYMTLEESHIFKYADQVIPQETKNINGVEVPYKIVASEVCPLLSWIIKSYETPSTGSEVIFNSEIEKIRKYSDQAITRLRARFIMLSQTIDVNFRFTPSIIAACCAIHNICERNRDPFCEEWVEETKEMIRRFPQPCRWMDFSTIPKQEYFDQRDALRDQLEIPIVLLDTDAFQGIAAQESIDHFEETMQ